jgi:hypothetical protein
MAAQAPLLAVFKLPSTAHWYVRRSVVAPRRAIPSNITINVPKTEHFFPVRISLDLYPISMSAD